MFNQFNEILSNKILETVNASTPADIGILTFRDGGLELMPGEIAPCVIPEYLRDFEEEVQIDDETHIIKHKSRLKDGDRVIYARTSKVRKYIILGRLPDA